MGLLNTSCSDQDDCDCMNCCSVYESEKRNGDLYNTKISKGECEGETDSYRKRFCR